MLWVLIIVLLILAVGGLPHWPHSSGWGYGYYPSGLFGLILIVLLVYLLMRAA